MYNCKNRNAWTNKQSQNNNAHDLIFTMKYVMFSEFVSIKRLMIRRTRMRKSSYWKRALPDSFFKYFFYVSFVALIIRSNTIVVWFYVVVAFGIIDFMYASFIPRLTRLRVMKAVKTTTNIFGIIELCLMCLCFGFLVCKKSFIWATDQMVTVDYRRGEAAQVVENLSK